MSARPDRQRTAAARSPSPDSFIGESGPLASISEFLILLIANKDILRIFKKLGKDWYVRQNEV
jgi:hypothetical protein